MSEDRIAELEGRITELQKQCELADSYIALLVGALCESSNLNVAIGGATLMNATKTHPWLLSIMSQVSEGREMMQRARRQS